MKYLCLLCLLIPAIASADKNAIVKCTMADGSVIFTNQQCVGGTAEKVKLRLADAASSASVSVEFAFKSQQSNIQVTGEGVVVQILPDDKASGRHQRFVIRLPSSQTVLIAHNVDIAPRINDLQTGDSVKFYGEYLWSEKGGLVHWTHHDPKRTHTAGWLMRNGRQYQ